MSKSIQLYLFFIVAVVFQAIMPLKSEAAVITFKKDKQGVTFNLQKGILRINICKEDIVEVKYSIFEDFQQFTSLVINNPWTERVPFAIAEKGKTFEITTPRLRVVIDKQTDAVSFYNHAGELICAESNNQGKSMSRDTVAGIPTFKCESQFDSTPDEGLFGLGCHPEDSLSINYKGRNQDLAIKYLTGAIPVLLSTRGFGLFWDNYSASKFLGGEAGNTRFKYVSESGKQVDYYFFYGPEFDQIINLYRTATGKAPMFPKWSFGLFQSQDRYKSQAEILKVKDNYRNRHIPVDVIVQDWYYWDPLPIGSHIMEPKAYPNPKDLVKQLHDANLHAMISIWPLFGNGTPNFDAMKSKGFLTDITWDNVVTHTLDTYYDAHNPSARALYWEQARDSLVKRFDWDAWWVDQCEPDNGTLLDARRQSNFSVGKGIDYFNTYSLEHTKGLYTGWRKDIAGKRAFFLTRQAFAGQQRNATTLWSSDITCTFKAFTRQIPQGINACTSGIPYWTSDIGGYHLDWVAPDWSKPENRELFIRWFQFGAFCPVFRIHGKGERALYSDNWDENTKAILLKYDQLRYRLLPYIYSLAGKVTTDNYTIMRSLAFDFRNDPQVYNIPDQYLFGPAFMVCPVTAQMYTGDNPQEAKTRQVYLPAASGWYDFWTGELMNKAGTITADATLDKMPLYIKAGSIIPMGPVVEYAEQPIAEPVELRIYPGANGQFTIYQDENNNYNYEKGAYTTLDIQWNNQARELTFNALKGKFNGMVKGCKFKLVVVKPGHGAGLQTTTDAERTIAYNGEKLTVKLP